MTNFLNDLLAPIFDKFKAKNPVVATAVIGLLVGLIYFLETQGAAVLGESASTVLQIVSFVLLGLQGSRTTNIINSTEKK